MNKLLLIALIFLVSVNATDFCAQDACGQECFKELQETAPKKGTPKARQFEEEMFGFIFCGMGNPACQKLKKEECQDKQEISEDEKQCADECLYNLPFKTSQFKKLKKCAKKCEEL